MNPSAGAEEEEDLTSVKWIDVTWLALFPLNASTALDYFSLSQFYSRNCNNELIKMQRLDPALLTTMTGIEYGLEPCASDSAVFVIVKRRRAKTEPQLTTLATYYIVEGEVFQAPNAQVVVANRFTQAMLHLRKSFAAVRDATVLTPAGEHRWSPAPGAAAGAPPPRALSVSENRATAAVLFDVFDRNRRIHAASASRAEEAAAAPASGI